MAITFVGGSGATSASAQTISVTHGLTISEDDLVLAFVHSNYASGTITDNNGSFTFTADYPTESNPSAGTGVYAMFRRVAGASEPTSYTFDNTGTSDRITCNIVVFSGVDVSAPGSDSHFDVKISTAQRTFGDSTGPSVTTAALTTGENGAWGIGWFLNDSARTWSNYSNSYANEVEPVSPDEANAVVSREFATAGSQGTMTADLSSALQDWVAFQFSIAPAPTGFTIVVPTGPWR